MNRDPDVPDFVLLESITEDALMDNLKLRYKKDKIYTYIGEVIVSVNPYKQIEELYSPKEMQKYKGRQMYEVPPHIYSLSNDVYRNMLQNYANQCVIISGESGAGKTEASKVLMQYIAAVSKSSAYNTNVQHIKNQLLDSNPVLEAFGNSKTVRNDNSSRFGKYMEIQFEHDGTPVGGKITNYLLEKSRIVNRAKGERSFHIFYQLLSGLPEKELEKNYKLQKDPMKYVYLSRSECVKVDTINDSNDFRVVSKALDTLGFEPADKQSIWNVLSGILQLGNVTFSDDVATQRVTINNENNLIDSISSVFGVQPMTLHKVLTSRSITTGKGRRVSQINIPLDITGSQFTRDALAKSVYHKLFDWLVERINSKLSCKTPGAKLLIGILDIYGFEIFDNNSFEQFCINLCNEKLQQLFIELTLKSEQEEYVREGIAWEPVKYFNNKVICDMIEGKPSGILSLMDECTLLSEPTDMDLLEKMNQSFAKHAHYESYKKTQDRSLSDSAFRLKHYAGDVTYNVLGFLEKTKDTLFIDLVQCMQSSETKLVQELYGTVNTDSKKRPLTAGTQFKNALAALMETLLACQPHYIRCIKPNDVKRANFLDEQRVRHQVRYLGLLENIRVRRAGFCYRQTYEKFVWRYKMICKDTWPGNKNNAKTDTKTILENQKVNPEEYRFGKTKIFLRNPTTLFVLEEVREKELPRIAILMQKGWRGHVARKLLRQIKSAIMIQKTFRGHRIRTDYLHNRDKLIRQKYATRVLICYRRYKFRKWLTCLQKTYTKALTEKMWGKYLTWPKDPKLSPPHNNHMKAFSNKVKTIYAKWRARKMVQELSTDERSEMRQKVSAYEIFHGKKSWDFARKFQEDYLELDSNPLKAKYIAGMSKLFQVYGNTEVLFADYATKISRKSKSQKRAMVVTEKCIYKQDPQNYTIKKSQWPLAQIASISLSQTPDTFVFIHCKSPYRDLILDLGVTGPEKYSEFVTVLVDQVKKLTDTVLPVTFSNSITYNNSRTEKNAGANITVTFEQTKDTKQSSPSILRIGKNNSNTIVYK